MVYKEISSHIVSFTGLEGTLGAALDFWIYDSLKITSILLVVVSLVAYLRTHLPPQKIRDYLKGKHSLIGYLAAALLGVISPFCSCSTIPLFLGFIVAGIPFGMTITFLFVSPLVNEAAIFILLGVLGWELTILYTLGGVLVGVAGGFTLTQLGMERYVKQFELNTHPAISNKNPRKKRAIKAGGEAISILKQVIPHVLLGVGIGALVHGFIPERIIQENLRGPLAVPLAVLVGVPIYTNIMGVIPVVESLIGKGLPIGTSLAFMMSVTALSLPQFIILKKVMHKELIITYALTLSLGIILLGLLFNILI